MATQQPGDVKVVPSISTHKLDALPLLAAGISVFLWSSAFVGIRAVADAFSPGSLALGRLLIGGVLLGLVVASRRERMPSRRDLIPIALCGLLWFGGYNVALNAAEQRVDAGTASLLVNIAPILIAVFAGIFLNEGFPRRLLIGGLIAFTGAVIIGVSTSTSDATDVWGVVLCVVAAFAYSAAIVIEKPVLSRVSALWVTWLGFGFAIIACLPFAPQLISEVKTVSTPDLLGLLYLGAFPTAIAFATWGYALARTEAGKLGITTYLVPVIAIILGWTFLSETPPLLAIVGGIFCLAGVGYSRRRSRLSA